MRIDNDATAISLELDPRARIRHYVGAFRRRWYLVVLPVLLGSLLGWFSAPSAPATPKRGTTTTVPRSAYYEATHVLIRESDSGSGSSGSSSASVNLPQAAYLVNTGNVPVVVAEKLGLAADDVESRLIGLPRDQVSSIEVKAVGQDPAQVVAMSDTAAVALLDQLTSQAQTAANVRRDGILAQLEDLDGQISKLNEQIAANPPDRSQLEAQQRSLSNQYSLVFQQFTDLANAPAPTSGLVSLEGAKAKPISAASYRETMRMIREGPDYVTGTSPPTTVAEETSSTKAPGTPAGPGTRASLGGLVGLALGVGLVLLLDRFDARLRRREDVEAASGLTVIAEIPRMVRKAQRSTHLQVATSPRSRAAEAYRVVRGATIYALSHMAPSASANGTEHPAAVIMVTSADPGEGKTTTVANLAAVFAESGLDVLVLNCDFRRPRIHRYLLEGEPHDTPEVADVLEPRATIIDHVHLITGIGEGSPEVNPVEVNPAEVVATQQRVIDAQRGNYDVILLDTAPFLATNDASELLPRTDLVAIVVRSGKTTRETAHRTAEVLARFSAPVLGIVFNGSDETRGAQYYYYGYGYGDRSGTDDQGQPPPQTTPPPAPPLPPAAPPLPPPAPPPVVPIRTPAVPPGSAAPAAPTPVAASEALPPIRAN